MKKREEAHPRNHAPLSARVPFCFHARLLPDRVLREELVGRGEGRVVEDVRVALEHIAERGPGLSQTSFTLLLLFRLEVLRIL